MAHKNPFIVRTGYTRLIMEACGVDDATAQNIERIMRVERPTLDALTKSAFNRLARISHEVYKIDPSLANQ